MAINECERFENCVTLMYMSISVLFLNTIFEDFTFTLLNLSLSLANLSNYFTMYYYLLKGFELLTKSDDLFL